MSQCASTLAASRSMTRSRARRALRDRDEAEVALGHLQLGVAGQRAEHRDVRQRLAQQRGVGLAADAVEDHARDVHVGVERAIAVDDRRDRARHRGRVDDQHDRCMEQLRHVGGRGQLAPPGCAVIEPHHTLDDGDVRAVRAVVEQRRDELRAGQERVEVATRAAGRERVVAGVDEVRADLERRRLVAALGERGDQPAGDGRLARAGARARDDDPRYHSIPCCARMPCVHRVLDLDDLADQVGGVDQALRGVAAGDDDVLEPRPIAEGGHDLLLRDPAVLDRVRELVEEQELVALGLDPPLDLRPPFAGAVGGLLEVARDPRPAVPHLLPVDATQRLRGLRLADLPLAGLHELKDPAAIPTRPRAQQHPERARRLPLAMTGDHDQQRLVARLASLGLGAAEVCGGVHGHAANASSGSRRAPAASARAAARLRRTGPCSPSNTTTPCAVRASCAAACATCA